MTPDVEDSGSRSKGGECKINCVWGGKFATAKNVPTKRPEEITMETTANTVFVNYTPIKYGKITMAIFADQTMKESKLFQIGNESKNKNETISFEISEDFINKIRRNSKKFTLTAKWAGGQYDFKRNPKPEPEWKNPVSVTVLCPFKN